MENTDLETLDNISYGMYIITTKNEEENVGCLANVVMQITAEPIRFSVCLNHNNYTNECLKLSKEVAINILPQDIKPLIIGTFGYKSSRDVNKFENIDYQIIDNLPVINESLGYIIGEVEEQFEFGTHTLFIIRPHQIKKLNNKVPLTYDYYKNVLKGRVSKNSPTYRKE